MVIIGYKRGSGRPWDNPWDARAREKSSSIAEFRNDSDLNNKSFFNDEQKTSLSVSLDNPIYLNSLVNDFKERPDVQLGYETLDQIVEIPNSINNGLAENDNMPYVFHVTDSLLNHALNILVTPFKFAGSFIPSKARVPVASGIGALVIACSSGSGIVPSSTDRSAEPTATAQQPTSTPESRVVVPPISFDLISKMRHPYQEPSNVAEEYAHKEFAEKRDDVVTYLKIVRFLNDIFWAKSALGVVNNPLNGSEWVSLFNITKKQMSLEPYPALETMLETLMSRAYNQTKVDIVIEHEQKDQYGNFVKIPDNNPDMDLETFNKIMGEFISEQEQDTDLVSQWTTFRGPNNTGYINVDVKLPLEMDWEIVLGEILSPPVNFGDRLYVSGRENLTALSTLDGSIEWQISKPKYFSVWAPAITKDKLFVVANDDVLAFDPESGRELWSDNAGNYNDPYLGTSIIGGDAIYNSMAYFNRNSDIKYVLQSRNIKDGSLNWEYVTGYALSGVPSIDRDETYVISYWSDFVEVHSIDKKGNLKWKSDVTPSFEKGEFMQNHIINPITVDDLLLWVEVIQRERLSDSYTCFVGFNLNERKKIFEDCIDAYSDNVIVSDGKDVYVGINASPYYIARYTIRDGAIKELPPINFDKEMFDLLLTNNHLFAGTREGVFAIERENPNRIHQLNDIRTSYLSFSGGSLYATSPIYKTDGNSTHIFKFSSPGNTN